MLAYLVTIGLAFEVFVAVIRGGRRDFVIVEGGFVETVQLIVLGLIASACLSFALASREFRGVYSLLLVAALFAAERELNYHLVLRETWSVIVKHSLQVVLIGGTIWISRRTIAGQFSRLAARPSFLLLISGFVLVTFWAQILGQRGLWRSLYTVEWMGKLFIEEQLELAGYLLVLFGVVEEGLFLHADRKLGSLELDQPGNKRRDVVRLGAAAVNPRSSAPRKNRRAA